MATCRIFLALLLTLVVALPALSAPPRNGHRGGGGHHGGKHHHHGHHGHGGTKWVVGVGFGYGGFPYWGGYYPWYPAAYYPAYPYYPGYYPAQYVPQQPTTYVEQPAPQAQPQAATGYWYYCADPGAYYPYIKECPAGWQRVAPQPSN